MDCHESFYVGPITVKTKFIRIPFGIAQNHRPLGKTRYKYSASDFPIIFYVAVSVGYYYTRTHRYGSSTPTTTVRPNRDRRTIILSCYVFGNTSR